MVKVKVRRIIALFCVVSLVMGMTGTLWAADEKIDINKATAKELQQLKGIGEVIAKRIVEYREKNGLFNAPEDIKKVKGIGDKTFDSNKNRIVAKPATKSKKKK